VYIQPRFDLTTAEQVSGNASVYKPQEMVGKKTDQVGYDAQGHLVSDDTTTFEKLNQAVNSCKDLVQAFARNSAQPHVRAIVPVLVVPSGLLWQVDYASDGKIVTGPRRVPNATLFLNHSWSGDATYGPIQYRLSHIEFVTLDALPETVSNWLGPSGFFAGKNY